jgi:small subunit ribosomal protein S14
MTSSSYQKVLKQIKHKEAKKNRFLKFNKPKKRDYGRGRKKCTRCGRTGAHISKYGLKLCRQCFREVAKGLGFEKYGHEV